MKGNKPTNKPVSTSDAHLSVPSSDFLLVTDRIDDTLAQMWDG